MCTVTFIPSGQHFFFTSSRDEHTDRVPATLPAFYKINSKRIVFPKDPQGGGTWIAVEESGNAAVLLNGAFKAHHPVPPYRKSRGLVLLDLISEKSPVDAFEKLEFTGIEPFTVILFEDKKLFSGKWDGTMKWTETLNHRKPLIWSSVTLYDPAVILKRETWFKKWISENPDPAMADIMHFHRHGGDGDPVNDLLMNRDGRLFTNSISSVHLSPESANFHYLDLRNGQTEEIFLTFQKTIPVKA